MDLAHYSSWPHVTRCCQVAEGLFCTAAGLVAERCFGFQGSVSTGEADIERDHTNARALGNSLLVCLLVPWSLCLLSYTGQHQTYTALYTTYKVVSGPTPDKHELLCFLSPLDARKCGSMSAYFRSATIHICLLGWSALPCCIVPCRSAASLHCMNN